MASDKTGGIDLPRWLWGLLIAASVLLGFANSYDAASAALFGRPASANEALGIRTVPSDVEVTRWFEILDVRPGGAAEKAGLEVGDSIHYQTLLGETRRWQAGEEIALDVARGEQRFDKLLLAQAPPERSAATQNLLLSNAFHWVLVLFFTLFLLIRGRGNRAATMLALMLPGMSGYPGLGFAPEWAHATLSIALKIASNFSLGFFWPLLALDISGGAASARQARLVNGFAIACGVLAPMLASMQNLGPYSFQTGTLIWLIFVLVHQLVGYVLVAWNYSRNDAAARNRIKIVAGAFVMFLAMVVSTIIAQTYIWQGELLGVAALALLAYGLLRQHLFDLNFAINRTLVYGAAAFTLLVTFGLIEYGAKSMIPVAWPTAGPFISAGIAVLLFLSFHRLHHWFEHHIERLFFRKWHDAEAALRRFVNAAGHFDSSPALCRATVEAVSAYADGAQSAICLRASDGSYRREAGTLDGMRKTCPGDDPAFALMRSERKPIELRRSPGALPGELALPMLEQGILAGFVLLAPKPDGSRYRPDEKQLLDWAVHHIGLDLRALHARQLEAQVISLSDKLAWAEKQIASVGKAKPKPA